MRKIILVVLSLVSLMACISGSIDHIDGAEKVEDRVKIYIDNFSSEDIKAEIKISSSSATFGGITINQNTTGSFIEVDFTKDSTAEKHEYYGISLYVITSDSAIQRELVANYNKRDDGIYMNYPRPKMIIKDSESTESAFVITRESY